MKISRKQIAAIIGLVIGVAILLIGFGVNEYPYGVYVSADAVFKADFYTYSYQATANAASNVMDLALIARTGISRLIIAIGLADIAVFLYLFICEIPEKGKEHLFAGSISSDALNEKSGNQLSSDSEAIQ